MNKRIIIVACTMACTSAATPPDVEPPVVQTPTPEAEPSSAPVTPPPVYRNPPSPSQLIASFTERPFRVSGATALNPKLNGKTIYRTGERTCFVDGEFPDDGVQRYPGQRPPSETVPCPPEMNDEVYDLCRGGVVYHHTDGCGCFVMGNPPPPARSLSRCPAITHTEETD